MFGRDHDEFAAATDRVGAPADPEDVVRAEASPFLHTEMGQAHWIVWTGGTFAVEVLRLVCIAQNCHVIHGLPCVCHTLI
jgi:hypothetical protein